MSTIIVLVAALFLLIGWICGFIHASVGCDCGDDE